MLGNRLSDRPLWKKGLIGGLSLTIDPDLSPPVRGHTSDPICHPNKEFPNDDQGV